MLRYESEDALQGERGYNYWQRPQRNRCFLSAIGVFPRGIN